MATEAFSSFLSQVEIGVPTLDRPFGIHLWPIFAMAWEAVVGYPVEDFKFVPFVTPMSTLKETGIFIVVYYTIIFGGRELMRNREPFKLQTLFLIHNFYLTAISFVLLVLFIEQLLGTVIRHGIFHAICNKDGGWTQPLVVLYYVCSAPGSVVRFRMLMLPAAELLDQISRAPRPLLLVSEEEAPE